MGMSAGEDEPEESTTTPEMSAEDVEGTTRPSIQGQQRMLRHIDYGPEELATTTQALAEEYDPEDLTTTTEASAEEAEETMRLSKRLR